MNEYRLSEAILPRNYSIFISPDIEKFTFEGKETISLEISNPTDTITLHSLNLNIKKAEISHNSEKLTPNISFDKEKQLLILKLNKKISSSCLLYIEFSGKADDSLYGLYRSKYTDKSGKDAFLLTTQFEAPYARKCFPCFDEPNKKATFEFSLKIPSNLKAISNMPIEKETKENDKTLVSFQKTPIMSTYLAYLGIGDFEFLEDKYKNIKLRIVTTPGKSSQGSFALEVTKKSLEYFEKYSGIPYPLPKLDLIALPDFVSGAMENWGAITFRELVLLHSKDTSVPVKKNIAMVVAHELWHQWSGNLVTMDWWDDLWLNESFATYMAYKALDSIFPEWKTWEDFVSQETEWAFNEDYLDSTHPIAVEVKNPNEIDEIFDGISYGKGGSVLRMIDAYLGPASFQKGVSDYLKKNEYKNSIASNFWDSLENASKSPIRKILESWINTPGHPIINCKLEKSKIKISQKRFSPSSSKSLWQIPLVIKTEKETIKSIFEKKESSVQLKEKSSWYLINPESVGFYKVNYSEKDLDALGKPILQKSISPTERRQIQNDLFYTSLLSQTPLTSYLEFLKFYKNEDSYMVLSEISANIRYFALTFSHSADLEQTIEKMKQIMVPTFKNVFKNLTWDKKKNEKQEETLLRATTINYLSFSKDKEIISSGTEKFNQFLENPESIDPDIKSSIFYISSLSNNQETYNKILNVYKKSENIEEKRKLLSTLYLFKNQDFLQSALDFSLTKEVRIQDLRTVFAATAINEKARNIFFPWIKKNWAKLSPLQETGHIFTDLIESLISIHIGKERKQEISSFLKEKAVPFEKTKTNAFEKLDIRTKFFEKNKDDLLNYFK